MKYSALPAELFQLNRKRFTREMKPHTIAIFNANDLMPRSGDQFHPFRQNAGLYYLSGIDQDIASESPIPRARAVFDAN